MYDDLKEFFDLVSTFRSSTSNILMKTVIFDKHLPELMARTRSNRLKLAIASFQQENYDEIRNAIRRR